MKNRFRRMIRFSCATVTAGLSLMSSSPASAAFWGASNELPHDPTMAKEGNTWYAFGTGLEGERGASRLKGGRRRRMDRSEINLYFPAVMVGQLCAELRAESMGPPMFNILTESIGCIMPFLHSAKIPPRSVLHHLQASVRETGRTKGSSSVQQAPITTMQLIRS